MNLLYRIVLLGIVTILGCEPPIDRTELGTIVRNPPAFDPYEEKYPLPPLGPEQPEEESEGAPGAE